MYSIVIIAVLRPIAVSAHRPALKRSRFAFHSAILSAERVKFTLYIVHSIGVIAI